MNAVAVAALFSRSFFIHFICSSSIIIINTCLYALNWYSRVHELNRIGIDSGTFTIVSSNTSKNKIIQNPAPLRLKRQRVIAIEI